MTEVQRQFLLKLADLCDEYGAGFHYTAADDGTHIAMDLEDVYVGFLDSAAGQKLREAAK